MENLYLPFFAGIFGLIIAGILALRITKQKVANSTVNEIGELIKEGSSAFLRKEYTILSVFVFFYFYNSSSIY